MSFFWVKPLTILVVQIDYKDNFNKNNDIYIKTKKHGTRISNRV
jgi:hypothetical protein